MPKPLPLHPDDEILSGCEDDVSSIQDGYTAWVMMADPASTLERHLVSKGGAKPIYRDSMTGGTVHLIQRIASTTTCPTVYLSRHASAF